MNGVTNGSVGATAVLSRPELPTQVAPPPAVAASATVSFAQSNQEIACTQDDLILEIAEQARVAIASSCRSGTCGTCKATLLSGEVSYDSEPDGLDECDRAAGRILTCIARPVGKVRLDV
nr:2Fe-2S iron-sulfur cluster-binding protein [Myxacorys almedinensis]